MPSSTSRRGLRFGWVLLIAVAAAVALWLLWASLQPVVGRGKARDELAAGLEAGREGFAATTAEDAALLSSVLGAPAGSRTGYYCAIVHDDQGWMVARWRQECHLRTVTVYPTTASIDEVEQSIAALPDAEQRFGPRWQQVGLRPCSGLFSFARDQAHVSYVDDSCDPYSTADPSRTRSVDFTPLPAGVPGPPPYVLVERTQRISNTDLGCAPYPLFCQAPFEEPAVGE